MPTTANAETSRADERADPLAQHLPRSFQGVGGSGAGGDSGAGAGPDLARPQVSVRAVAAADEEEDDYQDPLQVLAAQVYRTKSA